MFFCCFFFKSFLGAHPPYCMLTGFAGYSGNRGLGVEGAGKERRRRDTEGLRVMGNQGRRFGGQGGFVRFAYAGGKGVGWGCQLLDDSL